MIIEMSRPPLLMLLISLAVLAQSSPAQLRSWSLDAGGLTSVQVPVSLRAFFAPSQADLDGDGKPEHLMLSAGRLAIQTGVTGRWQSPLGWNVTRAVFSDLDQDRRSEVTLVVWRTHKPWPVDDFLPYGGRIEDFHDGSGNSCHVILVAWNHGQFTERWAGSALAEPLIDLAAVDLDGNGSQELVTVDGRYVLEGSGPGEKLKVWEWNGFGFTVIYAMDGNLSGLILARQEDDRVLILTP